MSGLRVSCRVALLALLLSLVLLVACRQEEQAPAADAPAAAPAERTVALLPLLLSAAAPAEIAEAPLSEPEAVTIAPEPAVPSVAILWNEAMLAAIRNGRPRPTVIARSLFMVHTAMYDAWSLYDSVAVPTTLDPALRRPPAEHTLANKEAAVSQAAYQMLLALFPAYEAHTHAFSNLLQQLGYTAVDSDSETAAGLGALAAQAVLLARSDDGSNAANDYADTTSAVYPEPYTPVNSADPNADNTAGHGGFDPNHWQPLRVPSGTRVDADLNPMMDPNDPGSYYDQVFLTPHWGAVRPFALPSGDALRPPAPPQAGSSDPYTDALGNTMSNDEAYRQQVNEILHLSGSLTDEQKVIAEYWADGPRSETPPGHWNALAHGICWRDKHTLDDDVKMFFALNGALFDASIAAWDAKRAYDYVRPASAIRHAYGEQTVLAWGGPDQGTRPISGAVWQPYQALTFVTPAFAEYVSGHSTFSMAAAEVLTHFTGSERFYDGATILYEDFNQDGIYDMLGQHVAQVGSNKFEGSPATIVTLRWETFQEAAEEAGISRRYGGIHFQDGDLYGRILGKEVGARAYALAEQYWTGQIGRSPGEADS